MIDPRNIPNLNHILFRTTNDLGAKKANSKNIADKTSAQMRTFSELIKGNKATIKNTVENTIPNDFSDPF